GTFATALPWTAVELGAARPRRGNVAEATRAQNRRLAAFTTCHEAGYAAYGRRMIDSFDRHWPAEIPLYVYYEGTRPEPDRPRIRYRGIAAGCPELIAFKERHRNDAAAHGREDRGPLPLSARRVFAKLLSTGDRLRSRARSGAQPRPRERKRIGIG